MNPKFDAYFKEQGFETRSPIQEAVYEPLKTGENVLGLAPTGSGKTLAFSLPLLERLTPKDGIQLLVIAPSQELAMQLAGVIRPWAKELDLKVQAIIGGANMKRQIENLKKKPEIIVGTPGRLLNLAEDKKIKLHKVMSVVIDEADDLLTDETLTTCRELISQAPAGIQLSFFSATETAILDDLKKWFGADVTTYDVRDVDQTQGIVHHYAIETPTRKRQSTLRRLANVEDFYALVFFNQLSSLQDMAQKLKYDHVPVAVLDSEQRQVNRATALSQLHKHEIKLLLTTDVAARGLDIPMLPAVVNYDMPKDITSYIHRVGRTGRMGAEGMVINLGNEHDLRTLKQDLKNTPFEIEKGYLYEGAIVTKRPERAVEPKVKKPKPVEVKAKTAVGQKESDEPVKKPHRKIRLRNQKNKGKRRKPKAEHFD